MPGKLYTKPQLHPSFSKLLCALVIFPESLFLPSSLSSHVFIFFFLIKILFCMYWCFACMYVHVRMSDLGVTVLSCHQAAGIQSPVLWKNSQCS